MSKIAADSPRKIEGNTVTGRGPFDVMIGNGIEIEFQSRGQLNRAREERFYV